MKKVGESYCYIDPLGSEIKYIIVGLGIDGYEVSVKDGALFWITSKGYIDNNSRLAPIVPNTPPGHTAIGGGRVSRSRSQRLRRCIGIHQGSRPHQIHQSPQGLHGRNQRGECCGWALRYVRRRIAGGVDGVIGIIKPWPWCHSTNLNWTVQPYSRYVVPECDDCQAKGPPMHCKGYDRKDRDAVAIEAWNAR